MWLRSGTHSVLERIENFNPNITRTMIGRRLNGPHVLPSSLLAVLSPHPHTLFTTHNAGTRCDESVADIIKSGLLKHK